MDKHFLDLTDYFSSRSAYCILSVPVPAPFTILEMALAARFPQASFPPGDPAVALAENLCRRMSNIDFFAEQITDAITARNDTKRAWVLNALLVAYFSASKSLLDAGAIAVAETYKLNLANKEMDFAKGRIWQRLEKDHGDVFARYKPFRAWMTGEVIVWRDAAVHRLAPLVIPVVVRDAAGLVDANTMQFEFPLDPDIDNAQLWASHPPSLKWVAPLHFHQEWRDRFVYFCSEVCHDIMRLL